MVSEAGQLRLNVMKLVGQAMFEFIQIPPVYPDPRQCLLQPAGKEHCVLIVEFFVVLPAIYLGVLLVASISALPMEELGRDWCRRLVSISKQWRSISVRAANTLED
ncbi:MAG: hypothetical protein ACR5K7_03125 [Symbiopectobacterium sp.]